MHYFRLTEKTKLLAYSLIKFKMNIFIIHNSHTHK